MSISVSIGKAYFHSLITNSPWPFSSPYM
jgi:hypothetical protein